MFATRIKQTLHTIIHTDQRGFIPGRYIGENIMEILSIIDKLEIEDKPGLLISIDFYKAFDTIEWSFIQKAFTFFNFPEYLTKWIRILYTNINSRIINNGHMSEGFNLTRGVRQGCPLSPCLFVIAVEILAIAIRRNSQIKGIVQNEREKKINQFADDTVLSIVAEDESLSIALTCIDQFKYVSGLSMNKSKSTIIRIGSITYLDCTLLSGRDLNWSDGKFQSLGINLSVETGEIPDLNYPERLNKITKCLNIWNLKGLSTLGRVLIVKSMAISTLIYQLSMLPTPSLNFMNRVKDKMYKFIWNNKRDKN